MEMTSIHNLQKSLTPCCELSAALVEAYPDKGKKLILTFMPEACTVIVLAHHVQASLEWAWFDFFAERRGNTCAADLHAKAVIENIERRIESCGGKSIVLPYPGSCGISFKRLAEQTSLGKMGDSYLFLHHKWGPWTHLRVLLTDAVIADKQSNDTSVCTHCGKCIEYCPGKSLSINNHDQVACSQYLELMRSAFRIKANFRKKCEVCARVCPEGSAPLNIEIRDMID